MTRSTPIVFFGSDDFARTVLLGLLDQNYLVVLVVTTPPHTKPDGKSEVTPVQSLAAIRGIEVITPTKLDQQVVSRLVQASANYGVLASYGKLLPNNVLDMFKAIVNVHPSLLPKWRGPSPIEAAILAGETVTGVSLMKLVPAMDAGPVYAQVQLNLEANDDQASLGQRMAEAGRALLLEKLPPILADQLQPQPQDDQAANYCHLIKKTDGQLDWSQPAILLERQVRAYCIWPKARAELMGRDVIITEARVMAGGKQPGRVTADGKQLLVECGQDSLSIVRLKPAGRAEMSSTEFMRGLKS